MKILGIDTTTRFLSLGIYDNGRICEYNIDLSRKHASFLTVTIKRVIEALGWRFADIDYFVCGLGPGSFTGIRVGLATIKGLAWSLGKPIVGISTLDILARNINIFDKYIVPVVDAKRSLVYCSIYKIKNGLFNRLSSYMLLTLEDFFKKVKPKSILLGDAAGIYREGILKNIRGVTILDKDYWYPQGRHIIELAREKIRKKEFKDAFKIEPIYLYPKECQIKPQITRIKNHRLHRLK